MMAFVQKVLWHCEACCKDPQMQTSRDVTGMLIVVDLSEHRTLTCARCGKTASEEPEFCIKAEDPRFMHHMLLLGEGLVLEYVREGLRSSERVYSDPLRLRPSVTVYSDGSWRRCDAGGRCFATGTDVDALRKELEK